MRLLVLSPILPEQPTDGDKLRLYHFLKAWSPRHKITLAAFSSFKSLDFGELSRLVEEIHVVRLPRWKQWVNALIHLPSSLPANVNAYASDSMRALVDGLLARGNFDAVFCYRLRMAPYALRARLPRVLDYTDSLTRYWERRAIQSRGWKKAIFKREAEKIAAYEACCADQFDACSMNSSQDAAVLQAMAPKARILQASNGIELGGAKPKRVARDKRRMLFIGNLAYEPNTQALLWFYKEILPLILEKEPAAKFVVAGGQAPASLKALASDRHVEMLGFVPDLKAELMRAGLSVCPVRLAAGRQNKILDAFATATPVVSTELCAKGVEAEPGRHLLASDEAQGFAAAVLKLMQSRSLSKRLGKAGEALARRHYDWQRSARLLEAAFKP
jgi:sugar transferase (PEP-CTERM/EpsH1 system associated)